MEYDLYYKKHFIKKIHFYGRMTLLCAIFFSLFPALYLLLIKGIFPGWDMLIRGMLPALAYVAVFWFIEPISYFPILGVSGSYMSFLSGNIANIRVPVANASQNAVNSKQGTKKAEVAAIIGVGISIIVNIITLFLLIVIGSAIIPLFPKVLIQSMESYSVVCMYTTVVAMYICSERLPIPLLLSVIMAGIIIISPLSRGFGNIIVASIAALILAGILVHAKKKSRALKSCLDEQ